MMKHQADCLIIGGGLAGWTAAWECVNVGLRVCLVHDGMGASPWVHGFSAPVHPEDSPEAFLQDTLRSGQGLSNPKLAAALCNDAGLILEWIHSMGLSFNREGESFQLLRPLGASYPRVVSIGNETGATVLKYLRKGLAGKLLEFRGSRAIRLLKDRGRVCGALVFNQKDGQWFQVQSRATVLAAGGYCGIYPVSTNKRDSGGDGIALAFEAGAELCDMEFVQFEPSAAVWPEELIGTSVITTLLFEGAVLRNKDGERFMLRYGAEGERVGKDVMTRCIASEIASGLGTEHHGIFFDATGVNHGRLVNDYAMYVKRYEKVGIDLRSEWIEIAPAPHTSLGGIVVDEEGSASLEGLYACGEAIGGLHGANRIGGNAGLETMVFGRRAGRSAAAYALAAGMETKSCNDDVSLSDTSCADRLNQLKREMQDALWQGVNVLREEVSLKNSSRLLEAGLEELRGIHGQNSQEEFMCRRLQNDMTAALLTTIAALERRDSLGCHARSDYPEQSGQIYRIVLKNDGAGGVETKRESLTE